MESETNRNRVGNNPNVIADGFAGPSVRQDDGRGSNPTPRTSLLVNTSSQQHCSHRLPQS